jgi:hypothetical protein
MHMGIDAIIQGYFVTVEHILSQKNAMSEMEFDPGTALQATVLPTGDLT